MSDRRAMAAHMSGGSLLPQVLKAAQLEPPANKFVNSRAHPATCTVAIETDKNRPEGGAPTRPRTTTHSQTFDYHHTNSFRFQVCVCVCVRARARLIVESPVCVFAGV